MSLRMKDGPPMMSDLIEGLRQNIRKLKPDGEEGFEGLIAAVLCDLTKRSFALASSGSQQGKDGQSSQDHGTIMFEAKRYDDSIPKDKIHTKILEIAADNNCTTELYIVAATCPVSAQYFTTLKAGAQKLGVELIILAWPETGLAELATLVAMTPEISANFIAKHTSIDHGELLTQLMAVRSNPQYQARSEELLACLLQPSMAPAFALQNNVDWLSAAFSSRTRAKTVFGQALCPADESISGVLDRTTLRAKVAHAIFSKPDGSITAILGADGNGKSWIFAQAWSHQLNQPLTVVIVPEDIDAPPSLESCQDLLISKIITQTGEMRKTEAKERWFRHFARWKNNSEVDSPRLIVFFDGINQRETANWLRFIDAMSNLIAEIGGRLAFSCRQQFYREHLKNKLNSKVVDINIPEWADSELDYLLKEQGSSMALLDEGIVRSLRNPRIFGVATALFKTKEISEFGELSVNRLLFEHIRSGSAVEGNTISSRQFANNICAHANEIVQRLRLRQCDDINEFDIPFIAKGHQAKAIYEPFVITSAGRFFEIVDEISGKYILKDEGLPLALGLALVGKAQEALRKSKNIDEALSDVLDPIAAIDRTCDIILGAIVSAVLEDSPKEIVASLVRFFVMLQNLDSKRYPEFRNLFGRAPNAFIAALEESVLIPEIVSNLSWLTEAISDLRGNETIECVLESTINRWLNMYSLAPERMVLIPNDLEHKAERQKRLAERERKLSEIITGMSKTEQELFADMIPEDRGDYSALSLLALQLLGGRPIAPFAKSLRNWCYATSLNGGYSHPRDEFDDLLHLNTVDWIAAKNALCKTAEVLRRSDVSEIGRWALVRILHATGDSADAKEADCIAEELTKDREYTKGWRLIENYCSTDPCDPISKVPDNINETAFAYNSIDLEKLCTYSPTQADRFFKMAQPGLARFRPDAAVKVLRALADQAMERVEPDFRLAVFFLDSHTICFEKRVAIDFIEKSHQIAKVAHDVNEDKNNEAWVASQYCLYLAFPHMSGDEQFDALVNLPGNASILLNLCDLFQPVDELKLERTLAQAVHDGNLIGQHRILCFADYSCTRLTAYVKELVLNLLASADHLVRLSVLSLIQSIADPVLLEGVVNSSWSAASLDASTDKIEMLHGSQALVLAADKGLITAEACFNRISSSAYESASKLLGYDATILIAERLDTAIRKAAQYHVATNLPDIEQCFDNRHRIEYFEISEKSHNEDSLEDQIQRFNETGDAWYERQRQNHNVVEIFERNVTKAGAQLILQPVTADLVASIDEVKPDLVDSWQTLFLQLDAQALCNLHNIALNVSEVISKRDAAKGIELLERLKTTTPHLRVTFGVEKISLDSITPWRVADYHEIRKFCFGRLDQCGNDHELAIEVMAAIKAKRLDVLQDYVVDRRSRPEPAHRARAVMVAGLSPDEDWAIETIEMMKDERGYLLQAYEGAKYAMERHQWSRHWAAQMRNATNPIDLWRYSVLLSKIVDGRFQWTEVEGETPSLLMKRFGTTFNDPIRKRIHKWKEKRETKLFGMKVPNKIFLKSGCVG